MKKVIVDKSYQFSLNIIKLYKHLTIVKKEYIIARQVLRAATSVGANVEESQSAVSKRDFIHKNYIALKEARESNYWLRILYDAGYLESEFYYLLNDSEELKNILGAIVKSSRNNLNNNYK